MRTNSNRIPWNKGTKGLSKANSGSFSNGRKDEKHPEWKGENACYSGIHAWVIRWKGHPDKCEVCGVGGFTGYKIQWANIDHKYRRVLDDYIRMCAKCHFAYDVNVLGSIRNQSKRKKI
jgi:hypothetical protein